MMTPTDAGAQTSNMPPANTMHHARHDRLQLKVKLQEQQVPARMLVPGMKEA